MLARTTRHVLLDHSAIVKSRSCLYRSSRCLSSTSVILPASADDKILLSLFDQPKLDTKTSSLSPTGLFGHHSISQPQALISLANATHARAQMLINRILRARQSRDEMLKVVKNLDRLSDMLCGVIDLAEFIRNAHPDRVWVEAANNASEMISKSINVLNTHVELYDVCREIFTPLKPNSWLVSVDPESCAFRS